MELSDIDLIKDGETAMSLGRTKPGVRDIAGKESYKNTNNGWRAMENALTVKILNFLN